MVGEEELVLHGTNVTVCGDTPASNYIGGLKECVSTLRKCRKCTAIARDTATKVVTNLDISIYFSPSMYIFLCISVPCN